MKALQLSTLLVMILITLAGSTMADMVDFEAEPLYSSYGSAYFHNPNDLIFVEDGVLVYITNYYNGQNVNFTFGRIKPSLPAPADFYSGHIFQLNNVGAIFDFTGPGDASFQYAHFGGKVNLELNSGGVLIANSFAELAGNVAPGLNVSVTAVNIPGGQKGTVTITGNVERLRIGGQEMYIDEVTGGGNLPNDLCDYVISHEVLPLGTLWGDDAGNSPGDDMFVEDGIKVFLQTFSYENGDELFGECQPVMTPHPSFGMQKVMMFNKISNFYLIDSLEINTATVSFEILSTGGLNNLKVNNGPLIVEEFPNMPAIVASGVSMVVETFPIAGGFRALVTLTGNVHELTVGGEGFYLDNLCVTEIGALSGTSSDLTNTGLRVHGNYPNPFNPSTTISFSTRETGTVDLGIFDISGHRVTTLVSGTLDSGIHEIRWNGRSADGRMAPAGVYFARISSENGSVSRKITMVK